MTTWHDKSAERVEGDCDGAARRRPELRSVFSQMTQHRDNRAFHSTTPVFTEGRSGLFLRGGRRVHSENGLVAAAAERGLQLLAGLREVASRHAIAGEARGMGLMLGIELVSDTTSKQPFPVEAGVAHRLAKACIAEGAAVYPGQGGADGLVGDHVLVTP